jgi:hypothetical protein
MIINRFNEAKWVYIIRKSKDTFTNLIDEQRYYYYKSTGNTTRLIYQELSEIMTGKGIKEQTLSILLTIFILQILEWNFDVFYYY